MVPASPRPSRPLTVAFLVLLLLPAQVASAATADEARTCAELLATSTPTTGANNTATPGTTTTIPRHAADKAYQTACLLRQAGLRGSELRTVVQKAAELDPSAPAPTDLLTPEENRVVRGSESVEKVVTAVAKAAGVFVGGVVVLLFLLTVALRTTVGRARALRNLLHVWPPVRVDPEVGGPSGPRKDLAHLPALFQSLLENLGAGMGGQNIQFVTPPAADANTVKVAGTPAPAQFQVVDWLLQLLRPLAPKDRIEIKLTAQPVGRQGLGITVALLGSGKGLTLNTMTLWESEIGLGGIGEEEPKLSETERYQLLVGPLSSWVYSTLADLQQRNVHIFGARDWRSSGFFILGSRLRSTHRSRAERLLRLAIDADPSNCGAR
ncbi:MAG: hypothetical protein M3198_14505 [Actinomycetota bacterium]|nr:hypothetical protein [Actinomycetota bacterium]